MAVIQEDTGTDPAAPGDGGGLSMLVCGEALVDLVPARCGEEGGFVPRPGGSPFNVAVGLGRLGVPVAFAGGTSTDPFGRLLTDRLRVSGVDDSLLRPVEAPSPLALVHLDPDGRATYGFHLAGSAVEHVPPLPDPLPARFRAVHVGSLALVLEPAAQKVREMLRRAQGDRLTMLDPNVRGSFLPDRDDYRQRVEGWLSAADVVKVSDEDLTWLYPSGDPVEIAREWARRGPVQVVVTRGAEGSFAVAADGGLVEVPGESVEVADTVGAGDAFTSGLLCWLHERDTLTREAVAAIGREGRRAALRFAGAVAAVTCGRAGADPPHRAEVPLP